MMLINKKTWLLFLITFFIAFALLGCKKNNLSKLINDPKIAYIGNTSGQAITNAKVGAAIRITFKVGPDQKIAKFIFDNIDQLAKINNNQFEFIYQGYIPKYEIELAELFYKIELTSNINDFNPSELLKINTIDLLNIKANSVIKLNLLTKLGYKLNSVTVNEKIISFINNEYEFVINKDSQIKLDITKMNDIKLVHDYVVFYKLENNNEISITSIKYAETLTKIKVSRPGYQIITIKYNGSVIFKKEQEIIKEVIKEINKPIYDEINLDIEYLPL